MGLWANATITVANPKRVNIKDIVNNVLESSFSGYLNETIVSSTYSKEKGVVVELRTTHIGDTFDDIIRCIRRSLKSSDVGHYYIEVDNKYL